MTPGDLCPICKRAFYREEHDGGEFVSEGCSEFCATQDDAIRLQFTQLKAGDWGIYPCAECGCAIEDEYTPGSICSRCVAPRAKRVRGELLREALPYLPDALRKRILVELGDEKANPETDTPTRYARAVPV